MNPMKWKREHQVAFGIAALIGAVLGVLVAYTTRTNPNSLGFFYWVELRGWPAAIWPGLLGAAVGSGIVYVRQLLKT